MRHFGHESRSRSLGLPMMFLRLAAAFTLAAWLVFAAPGAVQLAHAAPLEDCDGDGYDDATGVAVPWPGYDETHGDTPAGPGTADWWIEQQQGSGGSGGSNGGSGGSGNNTSGGGSTNTGGSGNNTSGGGSTNTGGSGSGGSGSGSGGSGSGSQGGSSNTAQQSNGAGTVVVPVAGATATTASAAGQAAVTTAALTATSSAGASTTAAESTSATGAVTPTGGSSGNLWEALTAGFTAENDEMLAGLSLLGLLAVAGGLALGVTVAREARAGRRSRRKTLADEPSAASA